MDDNPLRRGILEPGLIAELLFLGDESAGFHIRRGIKELCKFVVLIVDPSNSQGSSDSRNWKLAFVLCGECQYRLSQLLVAFNPRTY